MLPATAVVLAAGDVIWKADADTPVIVRVVVLVSPTPVAVMVTVPAVSGVTLVVKVPVESVVPVVAPSATVPVPLCVSVMVWFGNTALPLFLAITPNVAVEAPTVSALRLVVRVRVDPLMRIGSWELLPLAVATIVAVRVVALLPAEKVTVALPLASLTALDALRKPVSTENVTATPGTAAFEALTTVAVTVAVVLLSEATEVAEAPRLIAAAVGAGGKGVVVLLFPDPPPPQALSSANSAIKKKDVVARNEMIFNLCSCYRWVTNGCRS